mmetsp:Transcript_75120/g.244201  ORF Transcript_75120/g.244201 Transcript_75120/m.244201 type:complete len:257 (+) Transcript_75120:629-1399(+)
MLQMQQRPQLKQLLQTTGDHGGSVCTCQHGSASACASTRHLGCLGLLLYQRCSNGHHRHRWGEGRRAGGAPPVAPPWRRLRPRAEPPQPPPKRWQPQRPQRRGSRSRRRGRTSRSGQLQASVPAVGQACRLQRTRCCSRIPSSSTTMEGTEAPASSAWTATTRAPTTSRRSSRLPRRRRKRARPPRPAGAIGPALRPVARSSRTSGHEIPCGGCATSCRPPSSHRTPSAARGNDRQVICMSSASSRFGTASLVAFF